MSTVGQRPPSDVAVAILRGTIRISLRFDFESQGQPERAPERSALLTGLVFAIRHRNIPSIFYGMRQR